MIIMKTRGWFFCPDKKQAEEPSPCPIGATLAMTIYYPRKNPGRPKGDRDYPIEMSFC